MEPNDFHFPLVAHPTLHSNRGNAVERKTDVYFSIPANGITPDTGIVLLIAGFGGNARSNVYKKMRRVFADQYNLVTIQCDYVGYEFMQTPSAAQLQQMIANSERKISTSANIIHINAPLTETPDNYADMGPVQAMDCISAVLATKAVLDGNGYSINWGRSIVYGHSHGAYLAHLCNLFAPGLFNLLIDNSAWLFPAYLDSNRFISYAAGETTIHLSFEYLAGKLGSIDEQLYRLPYLYKTLGDTTCTLVIYQGVTDNLVNHREKKEFANQTPTGRFHLITPTDVDGKVFRSTSHGLGSDHLELFFLAYDEYGSDFPYRAGFQPAGVQFKTDMAVYSIEYEGGLPAFRRV